jgi:hypothetical protein
LFEGELFLLEGGFFLGEGELFVVGGVFFLAETIHPLPETG